MQWEQFVLPNVKDYVIPWQLDKDYDGTATEGNHGELSLYFLINKKPLSNIVDKWISFYF